MYQGLTYVSVFLVYCGMAGIWGRLLSRSYHNRLNLLFSVIMGGMLFIISSVWLPWSGLGRIAAWVLALGVVILYAMRPVGPPEWIWSHRFGLIYFGGMMLLTVIWSLFSQQTMQWIGLGFSALLTGLLIILRTFTEFSNMQTPRNGL
jgi:hypothetical protein